MKKLITLLAVLGMVLALAPAAQAAIVATGDLLPTATATWESGTVSTNVDIYIGNAANGTVTVNGATLNITHNNGGAHEITIGEKTGATNLGKLDIQAGGTVNVTMNDSTGYFQIGGGNSSGNGLINVIGAGAVLNVDARYGLQIGHNGDGEVVVDGGGVVNLTHSSAEIEVGAWQATASGLLTVKGSDGSGNASTVKTQILKIGYHSATGYVHMGVGGVLAVDGDKTFATTGIDPFVTGGLFTTTTTGEIRYNPTGDGTTWVNMNGAATEDTDYSLVYHTSEYIVNGLDLNGYTVLEMLVIPPAGTVLMIK